MVSGKVLARRDQEENDRQARTLGRIGDQVFVLGDHFLLDLGERELFRRPFTLRLNQAAADDTGHATPPGLTQAKSLLCARWCDKVWRPNVTLGWRQQTPSVVHPARELAGDLPMEVHEPKEALIAYRRVRVLA